MNIQDPSARAHLDTEKLRVQGTIQAEVLAVRAAANAERAKQADDISDRWVIARLVVASKPLAERRADIICCLYCFQSLKRRKKNIAVVTRVRSNKFNSFRLFFLVSQIGQINSHATVCALLQTNLENNCSALVRINNSEEKVIPRNTPSVRPNHLTKLMEKDHKCNGKEKRFTTTYLIALMHSALPKLMAREVAVVNSQGLECRGEMHAIQRN